MTPRARTLIVVTSLLVGLPSVLTGSFFFAFRDDELSAAPPPVAGIGLILLAVVEMAAGMRVGLTNRGAVLALALVTVTVAAVVALLASLE